MSSDDAFGVIWNTLRLGENLEISRLQHFPEKNSYHRLYLFLANETQFASHLSSELGRIHLCQHLVVVACMIKPTFIPELPLSASPRHCRKWSVFPNSQGQLRMSLNNTQGQFETSSWISDPHCVSACCTECSTCLTHPRMWSAWAKSRPGISELTSSCLQCSHIHTAR